MNSEDLVQSNNDHPKTVRLRRSDTSKRCELPCVRIGNLYHLVGSDRMGLAKQPAFRRRRPTQRRADLESLDTYRAVERYPSVEQQFDVANVQLPGGCPRDQWMVAPRSELGSAGVSAYRNRHSRQEFNWKTLTSIRHILEFELPRLIRRAEFKEPLRISANSSVDYLKTDLRFGANRFALIVIRMPQAASMRNCQIFALPPSRSGRRFEERTQLPTS